MPATTKRGDDERSVPRAVITGGRLERVSSPRIGIERPSTNSVITMTRNGTASEQTLLAPLRPPVLGARQELQLGLHDAEGQRPDQRQPQRAEPGDQGAGERRHDEQGEVARREHADRLTGEDHDERDEHGRQHPRHHAEASAVTGGRTPPPARSRPPPGWRGRCATAGTRSPGRRRARPRTPMNQRRSTATLAPPIFDGAGRQHGRRSAGRRCRTSSDSAACRVSMMPTAATTLASTGAVRSGSARPRPGRGAEHRRDERVR